MHSQIINYLITMDPTVVIMVVLLAIAIAPMITRTQGHIRRLIRNLSVFSVGVIVGVILRSLLP